jgi:hypothetical protein
MKINIKYAEYNGSIYKIIEEEHRGYAGSRIITNRMEKVDEIPVQQNETIHIETVEKYIEKGRHTKDARNDNIGKYRSVSKC